MAENKRSILVIDDNLSILRTMTRLLSREGYDVYSAQTGKEAYEKLSTKKFDAALIDVGLGETLGTDLLPQMSKIAPGILKIIFTGTPMSQSTLDVVNKDADLLLLKPVKPEILIGILHEKLKQ
jgi:DNA-binding NtrC family response regulator